jgi:HlyD family secretion protein
MKRIVAFLVSAMLAGCSGGDDGKIAASGTIEGTNVTVSTKVGGHVMELRVEEGSFVKKGDTLAVIENTDYRLTYLQMSANEEAVVAQYNLALGGSRKEDVLQGEANFQSAQKDLDRAKELLSSMSISQKQYDDTYLRFVTAEQSYNKLLQGLRPEEIQAARARRNQAAAQTEQARARLNDCVVLAPANGTVTLRAVETGELVVPGAHLFRITLLNKVNLMIYIAEGDLGKIRLGQKANVSIDSFEEKSFEGSVIYISPVAEFTPKNVQTRDERTKLVFGVKIQVDNPYGVLKPGLPADALLDTELSTIE